MMSCEHRDYLQNTQADRPRQVGGGVGLQMSPAKAPEFIPGLGPGQTRRLRLLLPFGRVSGTLPRN